MDTEENSNRIKKINKFTLGYSRFKHSRFDNEACGGLYNIIG